MVDEVIGDGESELFTRLSLKDMLSQRLKRDNSLSPPP
jgi:hypothetical protein